ncbi:MAG: HIT domain-containing protein [Ignavibacteriaceae bacterium]|nr:HIT domain-containing protein [Ignavibacteriaceae bacterium]
MEKTIFEKIADKEIPAYILDENDEFMAFLDISPAVKAQTLVIPKQQKDSYVFKHGMEFMNSYWEYVREMALKLDSKLGSQRCVLMFEGFEINHLHAKLFPIMSEEDIKSFNPRNKIDFDKQEAEDLVKLFRS